MSDIHDGGKPPLTILLAAPRGFCAGVVRAIQIVERALEKFGAPVYVRHEIVHNKHVLADLRAKGAVFVAELDAVPEGAPVIFSAHGVAKSVPAEAARRNMIHIDATCPLVSKVHYAAQHHHKAGRHVVLIGHAGHPEVAGTLGQLPEGAITLVETAADIEKLDLGGALAYVTQTTLSVADTAVMVAALVKKYPGIAAPKTEDICYATTNRQKAVAEMAARGAEVLFVIGSPNSSNANRLVEVGAAAGIARAALIDSAADIDPASLAGVAAMGISAGASTPEHLVEAAVERLSRHFAATVETVTVAEENVVFNLPRAV